MNHTPMITILNRAELLLTRDVSRQTRVRTALAAAGITYTVKYDDAGMRNSWDRARTGSLGQPVRPEYRIYVHRKDLDLARHILSGLRD